MITLGNILTLDRCPHCSIDKPNLTKIWAGNTTDSEGANKRAWSGYRCVRCGGVVTAFAFEENGRVIEFYPSRIELDTAIPDRARAFLVQALDSIHSPSGAIMLAATAVDAMLKAKNYKDGSLYSRIDAAARDHLITEDMARWAHQVRLESNEQRHDDENVNLPDSKAATQTVEFATALAVFLFVLPSRVTKGIEDSIK